MTEALVQPLKAHRLSLATQAQQYLRSLIEGGTYRPGEQLPSQAELALQLGISRPTLREALLNLEQEGVIVRRHGVGTFVAPGWERRLESGLERLESVLELASRQGQVLQYDALDLREVPADEEIAERLQVPPGTALTSVARAIIAENRPVAFMLDVLPASVLSPTDVDASFNGSVLDLLRQRQESGTVPPGQQVSQALAEIVALNADGFLVDQLAVSPGAAIVLIEEVLFDDQGNPIGFSRNYFVPEFFRFHVVRRW
jgi:GntR family transcriptional regulator